MNLIKKIVSILVFIAFSSTITVTNVQAADDLSDKPVVKKRKKAPKRKAKVFKQVNKADLKYVDKSESSEVHLYDPIAKKPIVAEKKKEFEPTTEGGKKFKSMGCIMCHKIGTARLGPSLSKLAKIYAGQGDRLIKYLKRDTKTKPLIASERAPIMYAQLAKLRILSDEQYKELSKFILRGSK